MKKALVLALGVLLLAAFMAPPAMAETKVEMKGYYRVRYRYVHNFNLQDHEDRTRQDNRFDHRFRIQPSFIVSDALSVHARIEVNNTWGQNDAGVAPRFGGNPGHDELEVDRIYGEIKTRFGVFRLGKMNIGQAGLSAALGYGGPGTWASSGFSDTGYIFDEFRNGYVMSYHLPLGNFVLAATYEKRAEVDARNAGAQAGNPPAVAAPAGVAPGYDDDWDEWSITPTYRWGSGGATMTIGYRRWRSVNYQTFAGAAASVGPYPYGYFFGMDVDAWTINPAVAQSFGPFSFHLEGQYIWGTMDPDDYAYWGVNRNAVTTDPRGGPMPDIDFEGWGVYADFGFNYGIGEVYLLGHYMQGRDYNNSWGSADWGGKRKGMLGVGGGYTPFFVAYWMGGPTSYNIGQAPNGQDFNKINGASSPYSFNGSNHWMIALWNDLNITEHLMVHAAIGYFQMVNTPGNRIDPTVAGQPLIESWDNDYGWEIDLGVHMQLMENMTYGTVFGYFIPGDYQKAGTLVGTTHPAHVPFNDVAPAWAWMNKLQINF